MINRDAVTAAERMRRLDAGRRGFKPRHPAPAKPTPWSDIVMGVVVVAVAAVVARGLMP